MLVAGAFLIGVIASILGSLTGGGAALLSVPLLLLIGLPPYTAASTPKLGALGIAIGSLLEFSKKNYIRWSLMPVLVVLAAVAGVIGAQALLLTPEYVVEHIIIVLLLLSVGVLWSKKDMGIVAFTVSKGRKLFGYAAYFVSELFRAAFGSGFGMLTNTVLIYFLGLTTLESTATKRLPGLIVTLTALVTFLAYGIIDIPVGIALFLGSLVGSTIGTRYAILLGNRWGKYLFTGCALLLAAGLLLV